MKVPLLEYIFSDRKHENRNEKNKTINNQLSSHVQDRRLWFRDHSDKGPVTGCSWNGNNLPMSAAVLQTSRLLGRTDQILWRISRLLHNRSRILLLWIYKSELCFRNYRNVKNVPLYHREWLEHFLHFINHSTAAKSWPPNYRA